MVLIKGNMRKLLFIFGGMIHLITVGRIIVGYVPDTLSLIITYGAMGIIMIADSSPKDGQ